MITDESGSLKGMSDPDWRKAYRAFVPVWLPREIFTVHDQM